MNFNSFGLAILLASSQVNAQSTEERFHDLFLTAGYSAAFGAGLGAALLSFTNNPSSNLRYVAVGASLGFIGGSLFGSYMVFSPLVGQTDTQPNPESFYLATTNSQSHPAPLGIKISMSRNW